MKFVGLVIAVGLLSVGTVWGQLAVTPVLMEQPLIVYPPTALMYAAALTQDDKEIGMLLDAQAGSISEAKATTTANSRSSRCAEG